MNSKYIKSIDIAIVTAMDIEMELYHEYPHTPIIMNNITYHITKINGFSVVLLVSEVGLTNAAAKTAALIIEFNPRWLFFSGIAGALTQDLGLGDVVIGKTVFSVEAQTIAKQFQYIKPKYGVFAPFTFSADERLLSLAESIDHPFPTCSGTLASSDYFSAPPLLMEELSEMNAISIDMESSGFSHACAIFKKPCLCVRGMSNYLSPRENIELSHADVCASSKNAAHVVKEVIGCLERV